jgi:hypothetical protein
MLAALRAALPALELAAKAGDAAAIDALALTRAAIDKAIKH